MASLDRLSRTAFCSLVLGFFSLSCATGGPDPDPEKEAEANPEKDDERAAIDRRELAPPGEVWITLGEDALPTVLASFQSLGAADSFQLI